MKRVLQAAPLPTAVLPQLTDHVTQRGKRLTNAEADLLVLLARSL